MNSGIMQLMGLGGVGWLVSWLDALHLWGLGGKPTAAVLFTDGSWRSAFEVNIETNPEIVYQLRPWMCFWLLVLNCVL